MATYRKKPGGWEVGIFFGRNPITGKQIRKFKGGFKTKKEAELYASQLSVDVSNGLNIATSKTLLRDFIEEWYKNHVSKNLSINTVTGYKTKIEKHIVPYLGNMPLEKIDTATVQQFYYHLSDKGLKPDSCKKVIEVVTGCFKYAQKLKLVNILPTNIQKLKAEKPDIVVWNEDELNYFLGEIKGTYLYLPVILVGLTGLRIGELCGLRWEYVDLDNGVIHVREQVIQDKINKVCILSDKLKTTTSKRDITIPKGLTEFLKSYKEDQPNTLEKHTKDKTDFVILSRDESICKPRTLSMEFTKRVAKYKDTLEDKKEKSKKEIINYRQLPQITIHGLRHSHATILLKNHENLKAISERLGHSSVNFTSDIYIKVLPEMKKETATLLDTLFTDL